MEKGPIVPQETEERGIETELPDLTDVKIDELMNLGNAAVQQALEAAKKETESGSTISGFQSAA